MRVIGVEKRQLEPRVLDRRAAGAEQDGARRCGDRGAEREAAAARSVGARHREPARDAVAPRRCAAGSRSCRSARTMPFSTSRASEVTAATLDELVANLALDAIPGTQTDALRHGRAARGPAHVSDSSARVQLARQHRHRSLPGERAVSRHAGRRSCTRAATASGGSSSARCTRPGSRRTRRRRRCSAAGVRATRARRRTSS